jgi:hypothetical protein
MAADGGPEALTRFASTRPGEIVVPVTVGAIGPLRFLLDTGSTHTAVTERLAAAVDAVPVARTVMRGSRRKRRVSRRRTRRARAEDGLWHLEAMRRLPPEGAAPACASSRRTSGSRRYARAETVAM